MSTIKMTALSFTFFATAVMHDGRAGAESVSKAEEPMAEVEHTAEVATALSSCPGVLLNEIPMQSGSTTGLLKIFFDSSTGDNCAMVVATGSASGHATFIGVCLERCAETSSGGNCTPEVEQCDLGAFHFFAGPVFVHAPGQCIRVTGELTFNGITVSKDTGATDCL